MRPSQTQVFLFDGERKAVQDRVNEFMRVLGREGAMEPEILGFAYNYQGPEWDGRSPIDGSASHGLMLIAYYPTINEARAMRGLDPLSAQPGAPPAAEGAAPVVVPWEYFVRALIRQTPPERGKPWWVRAAKWLFGR